MWAISVFYSILVQGSNTTLLQPSLVLNNYTANIPNMEVDAPVIDLEEGWEEIKTRALNPLKVRTFLLSEE